MNVDRNIEFKKSDAARQIVYGEVYAPNVKDTDGNWMTPETIEKMAHEFMTEVGTTQAINKNHRGASNKGEIVESFIVRKGDPDFVEGSWVVGVHVMDSQIWSQIEKGELTGFSIEGTCTLIEEKEGDDKK